MHPKVKEFLIAKKKEELKKYEQEKNRILYNLDLVDKVYSPKNEYSDEFQRSEWDETQHTHRYYKIVPIEITEDEYTIIKKYAKKGSEESNGNGIAKALTTIAVIVYIVGFISGIVYAYVTEIGFSVLIFWIAAFISGTTFLGLAEVINLLHEIKNIGRPAKG